MRSKPAVKSIDSGASRLKLVRTHLNVLLRVYVEKCLRHETIIIT